MVWPDAAAAVAEIEIELEIEIGGLACMATFRSLAAPSVSASGQRWRREGTRGSTCVRCVLVRWVMCVICVIDCV